MPLIPDSVAFQSKFADLPIAKYQTGEIVFAAGSRTGRLMILKKGAVAIVKDCTEIARVSEPGAIFGELSFLLDQPHAVDLRASEPSEFHVGDAATLLAQDALAFKYVSTILAQRVDVANRILIELKGQLAAHDPHVNEKIGNEKLLDPTDASLVYAGYPYDPYALRQFVLHQINAACLLLSVR